MLAGHLKDPREVVRAAVYSALAHFGPLPASFHAGLQEALTEEIREYYTRLVWKADIGADGDDVLLVEALEDRLRRSLDRICSLLALLFPDAKLAGLRGSLVGDQGRERAIAVELVDSLLSGEARALLIPALEASPDRVLAVAEKHLGIRRRSARDRLQELVDLDDRWLRECARHRLGGTMALSNIERILFLRGAEVFSELSGEDLLPLAERAREVHFSAGQTFIHQDEPGSCLYLIVDGEASVVSRGAGQISKRGPKGVIGEMAIIWRRPRSADCIALTDITAMSIEYDDFWELMEERPALAQGVITVLARRLDETMDNLQRVHRV